MHIINTECLKGNSISKQPCNTLLEHESIINQKLLCDSYFFLFCFMSVYDELGTIHKRRLPNGGGRGVHKCQKRRHLLVDLRRQREGGYPKNLKFGETSSLDGPLCSAKFVKNKRQILKSVNFKPISFLFLFKPKHEQYFFYLFLPFKDLK